MSRTSTLTLCAVALGVALAGCERGGTDDAATAPQAEPATTPADAQRDAGVGGALPETQPSNTTSTPLPGTGPDVPVGTVTGGGTTVAASTSPGPGGSTYLTDSAGNALYMLEGDRDGSACTGACLQAWPPLLVTDMQPTAGAGLDSGKVTVMKRADGASQVAYDGHPLYRYAADTGAGRTSGHDVKDQWGQWRLAAPGGTAAKAAQ